MSDSNRPLVSVIITTYNRPYMLDRAIKSALNQSYENIEVVVVDDNNPESVGRRETESLMRDYENTLNVKYVKHNKNMNGATARNTGIKNSSGEIISFLDDDDWYHSEKIKKQVHYLLEHSEFDAVYCGWNKNNKDVLPTEEGDLTIGILDGTTPVITNTILMNKDAAVNCGGWDESFRRGQEAAFLLRFFKSGYKIGVVTEILVEFDMSDRSNESDPRKHEEDINFLLKVFDDQIMKYEEKIPNVKKKIYSKRYNGVFLNYIKNRDYKGAINLYIRALKWIPIRINCELFIYTVKRILKK